MRRTIPCGCARLPSLPSNPTKTEMPPLSLARLRELTPARVALGIAGASLPTKALLEFTLDHARARDAVHAAFDAEGLMQGLADLGLEATRVSSLAPTRKDYLARPDLGRKLGPDSRQRLTGLGGAGVGLGDEIGEVLGACMTVMLIGERPGLSAADSLGVYLTFAPSIGTTDEKRNCVSNIHGAGLSYEDAAAKIGWLIREGLARQLTGVGLKDESGIQMGCAIAATSS